MDRRPPATSWPRCTKAKAGRGPDAAIEASRRSTWARAKPHWRRTEPPAAHRPRAQAHGHPGQPTCSSTPARPRSRRRRRPSSRQLVATLKKDSLPAPWSGCTASPTTHPHGPRRQAGRRTTWTCRPRPRMAVTRELGQAGLAKDDNVETIAMGNTHPLSAGKPPPTRPRTGGWKFSSWKNRTARHEARGTRHEAREKSGHGCSHASCLMLSLSSLVPGACRYGRNSSD